MIPQTENYPASSLAAILNSIKYDPQVCRWFLLLISQPAVKKKVCQATPDLTQAYQCLPRVLRIQAIIGLVFLLSLGLFLATRHDSYLLILFLLPYPAFKTIAEKESLIIRITRPLLLNDFPGDSLTSKTLYQIAEIYSRTHHIPSLVDTIYRWDQVLRVYVVLTCAFFLFIYPVGFWLFVVILLGGLLLLNTFIQCNLFYQRLN